MRRLALLVVLGLPVQALAHFTLDAPPAWQAQDVLGSPQKGPPCGNESAATPSNVVTPFVAGDTVSITINETIFHPGHYRVVLGVNGQGDLPADPVVTPGATPCGSTVIEATPTFPALADGQLLHTSPVSGPRSFTVTLPSNVTCTTCVLQIEEFMSSHPLNVPGGCWYHHCANISIAARPDADGGVLTDGGTLPGSQGGCACGSVDGLAVMLAAGLVLASRAARRQRG